MTRDSLAAFDDEVVAAVAADCDLPVDHLLDLLRRQQESVRNLPGVDDLVYEYRKAFARQPLVERRSDSYFLLVPSRVWPEFADALSLSEAEMAAMRMVHDRQFRAAVGDHDGDRDALVFSRP